MRYPIKITENFLMAPVLHTFGVTQDSSFVRLEGGELEVKMGIWFHETLPIAQVSALGPSEWPWWGGLGVKLHHHGVGVVGASENVVNVKFKTPQKVKAVVPVNCEQLWISIVDRDGFLAALSEATKVPVTPHLPF
jgi:hypothetical protein